VPAAEAETFGFKLPDDRHIALAVSGGSDSVAMLRLAAQARQFGQIISILTVDHGLRPGSTEEARWVDALARNQGFVHATLKWDGPKPPTGIQAKARQARYDLMTAWCLAHGASVLLTAHTRDDQAETVAMRMQRTDTALSLSAILPEMSWKNVKVARPLLDATRNELRRFLDELGQDWIDDPSNENPAFERVRVRRALAGHAMLAERAKEAMAAVQAAEQAALSFLRRELEIFPEGYGVLRRDAISGLETHARDAALRELIRLFGQGSVTPAELQRLAGWASSDGNSRRTLGGAIFASRKRELLIGREWGRIKPATVPPSGELTWDGRFCVLAEPGAIIEAAGNTSNLQRLPILPCFVQNGLPVIPGLQLRRPDATFTRCLR
jgi:tRNA(Ile)-lysidine synthase